MNRSRSIPSRYDDRSSLDALNRTIEGLEARIEGLMQSSTGRDPRQKAAPTWPENGRDNRDSHPAAAASVKGPLVNDPPINDPLREIRDRQRMLATHGRPLERGVDRHADRHADRGQSIMPERSRPGSRPAPAPQYEPAPLAQAALQAVPAADHGNVSARGIAEALVELRQQLKHDIAEGVARELGTLQTDLRGIRAAAESQHVPEDLRDDLARLAYGIDQLGRHGSPDAASLRDEYEALRALLDGLAREESVERLDMRWQHIEDRMSGMDTQELREDMEGLAYRIDEIKNQLGTMSDSPAIRALEQKLLAVVAAMEQLGSHMQPGNSALSEQFATLDDRLDEISRAIVAGGRTAPTMDQAAVQRLENRLGSLAEQIDRMAAPRPTEPDEALSDRIEALSDRIEQLSDEQLGLRLEERLEQLSLMLSQGQGPGDYRELTGYLADISDKIDRLEHGAVSDSLAERLDYLARRIDEINHQQNLGQPAPDMALVERIEDRLSDIAARLTETALAPAEDGRTLQRLEDQISHLSALISAPRDAAQDSAPASVEIEHRMAALENYMSTSDEYIIEAARQAAEAVVEAYSRRDGAGAASTPADMTALAALAEDLRQLEELTRSSQERSQHTFTALHTTLVQIADRLDSMEDRIAPPILAQPPQEAVHWQDAHSGMRPAGAADGGTADEELLKTLAAGALHAGTESTAANHDMSGTGDEPVLTADAGSALAASEAGEPKAGLLRAISRRLRSGQKQASVPGRTLVEPAPPLDPVDMLPPERENDLLEPGSGAPDIKKILERVRASQAASAGSDRTSETGRADYIAAARRAAKAAALETDPSLGTAAGGAKAGKESGKFMGLALARHRRPIMLAVGAVLLALMATPLVRSLASGSDTPAPPLVTELPSEEVDPDPVDTAAIEPAALPTDAAALEETKAADADGAATVPPGEAATIQAGLLPPAEASAEPDTAEAAHEADIQTARIVVPAAITPQSLADAAAAGDPVALYEIGARYTDGRGVATDLSEAANWYKLAADRGLAPAQYRLANLFEKGTGVERDLDKAVAYYRQAADAGNASAMHNLAVIHASGTHGEPDYAAAVKWFGKAAELGVSDSQYNLAILYARGNGVPQDLEASYKWFAIAARDGDQDAAQKRDEVAKAMRKEQRDAASAAAAGWKAQPLKAGANNVDPPGEWTGEKPLTTASVDMEKAVQNIQAILNKNGFDAGMPDGKLGQRTVAAIKAFQTSIGQDPTGKLNDTLLKELLARNT